MSQHFPTSVAAPASTVRVGSQNRQLMLLVAGVLGVSSILGVALNRSLAASKLGAATEAPESAESMLREDRERSLEPVQVASAGLPGVRTPAVAAIRQSSVRRLPELRFTEVTPPENPFRPSAVAPASSSAEAAAASVPASFAGAPTLPPVTAVPEPETFGSPTRPAAAPARAAKPATKPAETPVQTGPRADELAVTGIIQGDPAIAVVRYVGQSLFLKIGDQVADTWRLAAIGERSATFHNGEQRVEIPIKGGNSQ